MLTVSKNKVDVFVYQLFLKCAEAVSASVLDGSSRLLPMNIQTILCNVGIYCSAGQKETFGLINHT